MFDVTGAGSTMQAVARAKDKIKKFRRRQSSSCHERRSSVEDLPPPYSENPPFNPFYNDLGHNVSQSSSSSVPGELDMSGHNPDLELTGRRSGGGRRGGSSDRHSPMYPVLPHIPPYSSPPGGNPPPFSAVTRRNQFGRRDSFMSDTEDPVAMMGNLKLQPQ